MKNEGKGVEKSKMVFGKGRYRGTVSRAGVHLRSATIVLVDPGYDRYDAPSFQVSGSSEGEHALR
jgi:hypothetical protein